MTEKPDILYRTDGPVEEFEAIDKLESFQEFVSFVSDNTTRESALDTLLVFANIFEHRADCGVPGTQTTLWYTTLAGMLRDTLAGITNRPGAPRPEAAFENPSLYWSDLDQHH